MGGWTRPVRRAGFDLRRPVSPAGFDLRRRIAVPTMVLAMATRAEKDNPVDRPICSNRRAAHQYEILDKIECGIVLKGSEVKSLRDGKVSLEEAYARMKEGELWLVGCDIAIYPQASLMNHEPRRPRKLLLHKAQLHKFAEQAGHKGLTLVPLSMYFSRGVVKVKLAVGRGKKLHDKRETLKKKEAQREISRAMRARK